MIEATCTACGNINHVAEADVPVGAKFVTCMTCKARVAVPSQDDADVLHIETPVLMADISKAGYVTGIKRESFVDRRTGSLRGTRGRILDGVEVDRVTPVEGDHRLGPGVWTPPL